MIQGAHMRVFTISTSTVTMEQEQRNMAALLTKFRINFSDVSVIPDIGKKPGLQMLVFDISYSQFFGCFLSFFPYFQEEFF